MSRTKMRTREEWARLEKEMRSSGMTQKAWSEAYGINLSSMRNSVKRRKAVEGRLTSNNVTESSVKWIEAIPAVSNTNNVSVAIEVMTGRYVIKVPAGFDRMTFIDVCKALTAL